MQLLRLNETSLVVHGVTIATMVYLAKNCQETIQESLFNNYFLQEEETDNNEVVELVVDKIEEETEEDHLVEPSDVNVLVVVDVDADNKGQMVVVEEADQIEDNWEAVVVPKGRRIRIILGMMIMAILWKITLLKILTPSVLMTYLVSNCIKE